MIQAQEYGAIRAFVAVAEALSFSRAAAGLGVSPSALSQSIRALEERVGARLLHRTTRNVSLTAHGKSFLERVRPVVDELGAAVDGLRAVDGRPTGVVRVHAFRMAAELFVAPMLAGFARAHPGIVLDVTVDDAVVDVVGGGFDAAIRLGEVIERDMLAYPLGPELRQVVVGAPAYLAARGTPATPDELLDHDCIRWRWPGQLTPYAWEFCGADGRWFRIATSGPLIASSKTLGIRAALDGVGLAFAVEDAVAEHIVAGRLVRLLERWSAPFPGFFLCTPRQRHMAPALRAFMDALGVRG